MLNPVLEPNSIGPLVSFPVAINRPRTALHNVWRYDIHLIDWILRPHIYTACLRVDISHVDVMWFFP